MGGAADIHSGGRHGLHPGAVTDLILSAAQAAG